MLLASNSEMGVGEVNGKIFVVGGYPSSPARDGGDRARLHDRHRQLGVGPAHPISQFTIP
jgi:hypothetical protein